MRAQSFRAFCTLLALGGPAVVMFVLPSIRRFSQSLGDDSPIRRAATRWSRGTWEDAAEDGIRVEVRNKSVRNKSVASKKLRPLPGEAPLYRAHEYVEQEGADIPTGGDLKLYAIGSSSLVWMTWLDQFHLILKRLGYNMLVVPAEHSPRFYPKTVPQCDDTKYFEYLKTARFARIGWSSWDFAYRGWDDCSNGYRQILGHQVKCQHGPGCRFSTNPLYSSALAQDAAHSTVTLLASWFNDFEQYWSQFKCFGNKSISTEEIAAIAIHNLLRNIREIHEKNPKVWIVVLAKYTQQTGHITPPWLRKVNRQVESAVEMEERTLFVYYEVPPDNVASMYQLAHPGHPNCRGSKIMAHAIAARLYKAKVIGRSIRLVEEETNLVNKNCSGLTGAACHTSALCWVDPVFPDQAKGHGDAPGVCRPYGAGSAEFHTVCSGSICEGLLGASTGS